MRKITPRPWMAIRHGTHDGWGVSGSDEVICECEGQNREANARAIAALPELIEAAEALLAADSWEHWDAVKHQKARNALRSALLKAKSSE